MEKHKEKFYLPELDALRFIAFMWVFITHSMDLSPIDKNVDYWGYHLRVIGVFGVPIFFTLSAFLICSLLLKEIENYGKLDVKSFYMRRALRIWPLYFLVFFGIAILTQVDSSFGKLPSGAYLPFMFFGGNWYISINEWINSYPINPLWSISVEEQFYILIPLVMMWWGKKGLKIASILFFVVAYLWIIYFGLHPTKGFTGEWTNSFVQFQFFSIGIFLAIFLQKRQFKTSVIIRLALFLLGIVFWLVSTIVFKVRADSPHISTAVEAVLGWLCIGLGVVLMFFSFYGINHRYIPKPLIYLGRISFGFYMFHAIFYLLVFVTFKSEIVQALTYLNLLSWKREISIAIGFTCTFITASLSYRYFERPFLLLKKKFTKVESRM